jgi:hypothetical protein
MNGCVYRHVHTMAQTWRCVFELHTRCAARKFLLRQGLWIEDLQTPPGQECSNGSKILLAVVLWRAFFGKRPHSVRAVRRFAMKLLKIKTARFSQVIESCGKPQVYTLWQKPSADRHLQAEIKKNRVMTILRTESGTDFGIAGFKESREARYLIFPKSLKRFAETRIIGIDWALVRE